MFISATLWTAACQTPLSMRFSRQGPTQARGGLLIPPPGDLPEPGSYVSLMSPALAGRFFTINATCIAFTQLLESAGFGKFGKFFLPLFHWIFFSVLFSAPSDLGQKYECDLLYYSTSSWDSVEFFHAISFWYSDCTNSVDLSSS